MFLVVCLVSVGVAAEPHLAAAPAAGGREAMLAGANVQLGDQVAGGGEHDAVPVGGPVGRPGGEQVLDGGGLVADMNAVLVEVVAERGRVTGADGEGGGAFGGVAEPDHRGKRDRAVGLGQVTQDAAGGDRGELLVVADQPNRAAAADDPLDRRGEVGGGAQAGLVDDHQGALVDGLGPRGQPHLRQGVDEFGQGVAVRRAVGADLGAQHGARHGGRG